MSDMVQYFRDIYADRHRKDAAAMAKRFAPGAALRINGFPDPMPGRSDVSGEVELTQSLKTLIDAFTFLEIEIVKTVIQADTAAVHWIGTVRHNPSGRVETTGILDLFTVKDGKVTSYLQFCDTALVAAMLTA